MSSPTSDGLTRRVIDPCEWPRVRWAMRRACVAALASELFISNGSLCVFLDGQASRLVILGNSPQGRHLFEVRNEDFPGRVRERRFPIAEPLGDHRTCRPRNGSGVGEPENGGVMQVSVAVRHCVFDERDLVAVGQGVDHGKGEAHRSHDPAHHSLLRPVAFTAATKARSSQAFMEDLSMSLTLGSAALSDAIVGLLTPISTPTVLRTTGTLKATAAVAKVRALSSTTLRSCSKTRSSTFS